MRCSWHRVPQVELQFRSAQAHAGDVPPRLVIGLAQDADKDRVQASLRDLGVQAGLSAHPAELPDVLVGQTADAGDTDELLRRISAIDGVAYAERESIFQAFNDSPEG